MADVFDHTEFLEIVIRRLDAMGIEYLLAGSWASSVYGEPRQTLDVDIVINPKSTEVEQPIHFARAQRTGRFVEHQHFGAQAHGRRDLHHLFLGNGEL